MGGAMGGFLAGSIVAKMVLDKTGWNSSITAVGKDADTLKSKFGTVGVQVAKLGTMFPLVGAAILGTMGAIIKRTADYRSGLWELSQQTGVSVEDLSSFKLALDTSGASLDTFALAMKFLSGKMADAAAQNPVAIKTFSDLGVSFQNIDGSLRPLKEVFLDVSEKFSTMQDGARKTAAAVDLFGRGAMDIIPTLNLGRDGFAAWIKKAEEFGMVVSTKDAQAADDFKDKLKTLQLSFDATAQKLAVSLLPMLTTFVEKVTEVVGKVGKWIEQNPELIKQLTETAFKAGALMTAVILLTNPIYAVAAAAAAAVVIFIQLQAAEDAAQQAADRFDQVNTNFMNRLKEAADAAGITRAEFHQLAEKYDNSAAAMGRAIQKGKEGKELQEALAEVGKKHKKVVDEQREAIEKAGEAARIATLKKAGLLQVTQGLIPPVRDLAAEQLYLSLVWDKSLPKVRDLGDALTKYAPTVDEIAYSTGALATVNEQTMSILQAGWEGLYTDLAQGWGDLVAEYCAGGMTLENFMEGIWDNIEKSFYRMIGDMVSKWVIDGMKKIMSSAVEAGAGITSSLGASISTLSSTAAGLGTTIASTIVALATGIATAAKILAGAAKELLIVGAIAVAIYAGFSLVNALLGGGGGKSSDVTFWLKPISERLQELRDYAFIVLEGQHLGYMHDIMVDDNKCMWDLVYKGQTIIDILADSNAKLQGILDRTGHAQAGAFVMGPTLMAVGEQAPRIPEIILPEPIYERNLQAAAAMGGGGQLGRPVEIYLDRVPLQFPFKQNVRKCIIELIPQMTKNEQLIVHARSIKTF